MALWQRESSDLLPGVLRGDHEKRLGESPADPVRCDLILLHGLKQRALRFRGGAVDLVDENHRRKDRTGVEDKAGLFPVEDRIPDDVRGQQVTRELNASELQTQGARHRLRERGFAHARDIFDEEVSPCQQTNQRQTDGFLFADDHFSKLAGELGNAAGHERGGGWLRQRRGNNPLIVSSMGWKVPAGWRLRFKAGRVPS